MISHITGPEAWLGRDMAASTEWIRPESCDGHYGSAAKSAGTAMRYWCGGSRLRTARRMGVILSTAENVTRFGGHCSWPTKRRGPEVQSGPRPNPSIGVFQ